MSKTKILAIPMLILLPLLSYGQSSTLVSAVSNFGTYGDPDDSLASGRWPGESGFDYIWEGRYWVGAVVAGERHVSHADYGDYEWNPPGGIPYCEQHVLGAGTFVDTSEYNDFIVTITHFPLGLTVTQIVEAFPEGTGPDEAFLVQQTLRNEGGYILDSVYIAWVFDCDVASGDTTQCHIDDWVSYQPERSMGYMWDGDNPNEPGDDTGDFGLSPGYIGIALLEAPLPLCSFQWWNWNNDPGNDDEKFQYMAGIHPASGGHAFRADPDSVMDYRVMISTGPYTLPPGDSIYTEMTFAVGEGMDGLNNAVDEITPVELKRADLPLNFQFCRPFPNPFNIATTIRYTLPVASWVDLAVYDISGNRITALVNGWRLPGIHVVSFDASGLASGIYIYRLKAGDLTTSGKMVLMK